MNVEPMNIEPVTVKSSVEPVKIELQRAKELKQALANFVLDAEGDLATALESFSASQLARTQQPDFYRRELVIDRFVVEGMVGDRTPLDYFMAEQPDLSEVDRQLLQTWRRSFVGLFAVAQVLQDGFELTNWTTAKSYVVKLTPEEQTAAAKLKEGDILLAQIAPVQGIDWMFSSKWIALGRLGKPKLAVAIGNFKQNYRNHLYSDAPELLAEAWKSVEKYHQNFIDFFGSHEVTLPGYQLSKKLAEFQEATLEKQMDEAGIDRSKSLQELAEEAGVSQAEIEEAASAMGADAKVINRVLDTKQTKMMAPTVELPAPLKKAEQVTVITHPRWGQVFLTDYGRLKSILEAPAAEPAVENAGPLVRKYLEDPAIPVFVWYQLAEQYPEPLEALIQQTLERSDFKLSEDLDSLLVEFGKMLQTELPDIASVPLHLHNLFQEAVVEVSKDKPKKKKAKATMGFQR